MLFAALRFYKDGNIADRLYWYRSDFPVKEGETVFAPVGTRNRLQKAVVERVTEADAAHAPYDVSIIKSTEARCETQTLCIAGRVCKDLGGIRYDDRHYTRFHRVFVCDGEFTPEQSTEALAAGFEVVLRPDAAPSVVTGRRVLIAGQGAEEFARRVIASARGRENGIVYSALARLLTEA